mgnify:CR=1 FL=1
MPDSRSEQWLPVARAWEELSQQPEARSLVRTVLEAEQRRYLLASATLEDERMRLLSLGVYHWLTTFLDGRLEAYHRKSADQAAGLEPEPVVNGSPYMEGDGLG